MKHLKKYIRAAGIRVSNYNELLENCKSIKSKKQRLAELLEEKGMKGKKDGKF